MSEQAGNVGTGRKRWNRQGEMSEQAGNVGTGRKCWNRQETLEQTGNVGTAGKCWNRQPIGLRDSSRGLSVAIPPDQKAIVFDPERVTELAGTLQGACESPIDCFRGSAYASTPAATFLATGSHLPTRSSLSKAYPVAIAPATDLTVQISTA
jgi:hypothetical protein